MCLPMFFLFMAYIEFSNAHMLGQLGNTVCQLYPSDDYIADNCKNVSPTVLCTVCVISMGQIVSLVALQR